MSKMEAQECMAIDRSDDDKIVLFLRQNRRRYARALLKLKCVSRPDTLSPEDRSALYDRKAECTMALDHLDNAIRLVRLGVYEQALAIIRREFAWTMEA